MRHGMRKPRGLKERCYVVRLIELNEYLASLPGATLSKNGVNKLSKPGIAGISNHRCRTLILNLLSKNKVYIFEKMDIADYIYKYVV